MIVRGKVTRVSGAGVWVVVPRLGRGERGPVPYARHRVTLPDAATASAGHSHGGDTTGAGTHSHDLPERTVWSAAPRPGDPVLIGLVEDSIDELIVLGVQAE